MELVNSLNHVAQNNSTYNSWRKREDDVEAQRQVLHKTISIPQDRLEMAKSKGLTITHALDVMEERAENETENINTIIDSFFIAAMSLFGVANLVKRSKIITALMLSMPIVHISVSDIILKKVEKLARFNSRNEDLGDPRNFVIYTPDQLKKARVIAKEMPDPIDKSHNDNENLLQSIKSVRNDQKKFELSIEKSRQKEKLRENLLPQVELTPECIDKINADKGIISNSVKKVTLKNHEYTENVENAIKVIQNASFIPAGLMAVAAHHIVESLQNKNILNFKSISPSKVRTFAALVAGAILPIYASIEGGKLSKKASKLGRFKAEQELRSNYRNFYHYSSQELDSVNDVKSQPERQNFFSSAFKGLKYLFKDLKKDLNAYNLYHQTKGKDDRKFREALKLLDVTPEQMKEAKSLQKKVFRTFETIEDESAKYEETIATGTEYLEPITPFITAATVLGLLGALKYFNLVTKMFLKPLGINKTKSLHHEIKGKNLGKAGNFIVKPFRKASEFMFNVKNEFRKLVSELSKNGKNAGSIKEIRKLVNKVETKDILTKILKDKDKKNLKKALFIFTPMLLGTYFLISFMIQTLITQTRKKATKVGLMQAMQKLDDPKLYIDPEEYLNNKHCDNAKNTDKNNKELSFDNWLNYVNKKP